MIKTNLFCLPFAGGSKYSYRGYVTNAPANLNVEAIELPGRGTRFHEPLLKNAHIMAEDVLRQITPRLHEPYALYGHSMGSLIVFLVARLIRQRNLPEPIQLFLTGAGGPSIINRSGEIRYQLPFDAFYQKIKELGGINNEVLENKDMMRFFEPILRADFQVVETYRYEAQSPLKVPVTVIIGIQEKATYEDACAWQAETIVPIEVRQLPGKHFFIFDHESDIIKLIGHQILLKTATNEQQVNLPQA